MYQKIKLSQPYLCCLSPIVQPPDIKTTSWYKWGGKKLKCLKLSSWAPGEKILEKSKNWQFPWLLDGNGEWGRREGGRQGLGGRGAEGWQHICQKKDCLSVLRERYNPQTVSIGLKSASKSKLIIDRIKTELTSSESWGILWKQSWAIANNWDF